MLKKALASLAALVASSPAAFAGPYVNYETNVSFTGSNYNGSLHELHLGFEGATDYIGYYVQAGPAAIVIDGAETDVVLSGKAGLTAPLSSKLDAYGELSFLTSDDDNGYGVKGGIKYSF